MKTGFICRFIVVATLLTTFISCSKSDDLASSSTASQTARVEFTPGNGDMPPQGTGAISGLLDPVPLYAFVIATNKETGTSSRSEVTAKGTFMVSYLAAGPYIVEVRYWTSQNPDGEYKTFTKYPIDVKDNTTTDMGKIILP